MRLVLTNRPADRPAKLIQPQRRLCLCKEAPGIQCTIPQKLECASMKLIRPGSRGQRNYAACRMSMLGTIGVADHPKLLHRIHWEARHLLGPRQADGVCDIASVEREILVSGPAACH